MNTTSLLAQATPYYTNDMHTASVSDATAAGLTAIMIVFICLFVTIAYVATSFLLGRIFKKAGEKSWKAWVPVYNTWVLLKLGDQQGFWAILLLLPIVNIVAVIFTYMAYYRISLKLGKDGVFVLLAIFFPIIWMIWLAVDSSTWQGKKPVSPADNTTTPAI